ncbi:hypothetical protein TTHT_1601 [Thermotomaculum hydrothermale]|uniref:FecR protein domain-containing protein n=1 Tax=Thermotomaculum hydrothermale TaxID=981385 RepID=A0A7R6SZS1_9BACT|nr:FecR domain-containing protein [Thermotomaculum hydrothermale]BBB33090.1 hypothetical protein TTHT_1601 [Thermotomaculum hydrothermale]
MKFLKYTFLFLLVLIPVAIISVYTVQKTRQKKVIKHFYNSLNLMQKAYPFISFSSSRNDYFKMLDKADEVYKDILTYRLSKAEKEISEIEKFAKEIVTKRKSSYISEAHIADFVGDVHILGGGNTLLKAEIDTKIREKDVIKCGEKSGCKIGFIDGSIFTIKSNSTIVFEKINENKKQNLLEISIKLLKGKISVETLGLRDFDQDFSINVKGTIVKFKGNTSAEIELRNAGKEVAVFCYDGTVRVMVNGGDQIFDLTTRLMCRINIDTETVAKYKIPPAPRAEEPINLSTIDRNTRTNIVFKWAPSFNVTGYYFQLSKDHMFANVIVEKFGYSGTTLILPMLDPGTYYWRVAAINSVNERGQFSEIIKFTVISGSTNNFIDNTPPEVNIEKINVFGSVVIVSGRTEPGATLIINNHLVEVGKDGKFSFIQKMYQKGKNAINIIARDAAGNETKITKYAVITVD